PPILNILKKPLDLMTLFKREFLGLVFFHRNMVVNEKLTKENELLKLRLNNLQETELENSRLKELLELKEKTPYKVVAARVIARQPDNWSSSIIINRGARDGIKQGDVVISYLGLAGRVSETTSGVSKVTLINNPNFCVSALVQRSRQEGLICGTLDYHSLIMKYLPRQADIKISDSVITSGLTRFFPKGLVIGEVTSIGEEFSGLSRYAVVKPAINFSDIEEVLVVVEWE
ncbi:MAG: rod shape-determining protein MreC, partial [Candidatus Omnitrophota bacterium]